MGLPYTFFQCLLLIVEIILESPQPTSDPCHIGRLSFTNGIVERFSSKIDDMGQMTKNQDCE